MTIFHSVNDLWQWVREALGPRIPESAVNAYTQSIISEYGTPEWGRDWQEYLSEFPDPLSERPISLMDYADSNERVVLWWTSLGCPTGQEVALGHPDITLADDLGLNILLGVIGEDGSWNWNGQGKPCDMNRNSIRQLEAHVNPERWSELVEDYESSQ